MVFSGRSAKKLDGFSSKIGGLKITEFPVILIGQIGKNDKYCKNISGKEVLQYCLGKVLEGQSRLGGRIVMLECKNIDYIIKFYEEFGFNLLERDYETDELLQMIRIFTEEELICSVEK